MIPSHVRRMFVVDAAALGFLALLASAVGCGSSSSNEQPPVGTGGSDAAAGSGGSAGASGKGGSAGATGGAGGSSSSCKGDSDCPAATPVCDISTGKCVGCLPDGKPCPDGSYCDATNKCSSGCASDGDCDNGGGTPLVCDTTTHKCVGCASDASCPLGSICKASACVPGCTDKHACQTGSQCCAGQCFDIKTDPEHCGGCTACPEPAEAHAPAICNNSVCGFGACADGFGDCNNDAVDGCEADLQGQTACACVPGTEVDCYEGPPGTLGNGPCVEGKKTCNPDGNGYGECVGQHLPQAETCSNDIDDDCNGTVNDGGADCACLPNATDACYSGPDATRNVGLCKDGTKTCDALGQSWGACTGEVLPALEDCALAGDENCDGQVNEAAAGCLCEAGATQPCYGGPAGTQGVGPCTGGTQTCNSDGKGWGSCAGEVLPQPETCFDDVDNDCNGQVNEGGVGCVCTPNATDACYSGPPSTLGVGVCIGGIKTCNAIGTAWGSCIGEVLPEPESCLTAEDDNCNAQVNEGGAGCVCAPGSTATCYTGPVGTLGVGVCQAGTKTCNSMGTDYGPCTGEVVPTAETCNTPADDDCDGAVNEDGAGCVCAPNSTAACYTGPAGTLGVGACMAGTKQCDSQGTAYGACVGEITPLAETCNTTADDDCDGQVNESGAGCVCTPGATKSCYTGPAGTVNVGICKAGVATCDVWGQSWGPCADEVVPQPDSCATPADDDCNGSNKICTASQDCNPNTGACDNPCDPAVLGKSYIGCEYFPTVTTNVVSSTFHFAVVIANTRSVAVNYTITRGTTAIASGQVAANSVGVVSLPWISELMSPSGTLQSTNAAGNGAYRLVADRPVTVYQYNPLEYTLGGGFSYTNDASLLLPTNAWRGDYIVAARNDMGTPGFYAITASQNGTVVTLGPSATGGIVRAGAGVAANGTGTVTLNAGDVLQVLSTAGGGSPDISDLTGTRITATKPVQVIGGHQCTYVPYNIMACDHIEESLFPIETLSKSYLVTTPWIAANTLKNQLVRVIATLPGTTLVYDPPQAGFATTIANAGQYIELPQSQASYKVTSNNKILVVQYMLGQGAGGDAGDPAMAQAVAIEQYRGDYLFHAPTNYQSNFVNITAPTGATVMLDGAAVPAASFAAIGASGFSIARVSLSNAGTGNHSITSPLHVGISVYGYGQYTSYWYPGGLDLTTIQQ